MSAQRLRAAAAAMRVRAEALEGRRWTWTGVGDDYPQYVTQVTSMGNAALVAETFGGPEHPAWEADHIASWHPAVALAVADLLDVLAKRAEDIAEVTPTQEFGHRVALTSLPGFVEAIAVADAYLPPDP